MTALNQWNELLACSSCGQSGQVQLSQPKNRSFEFSVEAIPPGFKVVHLRFGETFYCGICNQPADTRRSCPRCDTIPSLARQILDSRNGKTVRMFECKCGKHSWSE
jgi:hypothetical protein